MATWREQCRKLRQIVEDTSHTTNKFLNSKLHIKNKVKWTKRLAKQYWK